MITKETARRIYNCYQQIEEIDRLKKEMLEEVERQGSVRQKATSLYLTAHSADLVKVCSLEYLTE